ncbi:MAG: hypothetical protein HOP33_09070 [Verrucomicrobia bacterium]|nr:hypothetical protein [Verrucomicrobiota bacterium]
MNARETRIAKRILDHLHENQGQHHVISIHAEIGGMAFCSAAEFDAALTELDSLRFVTGVKSDFKGVLWKINAAGEAARLEMR